MDILINTYKNKKRIKAIKLQCQYYCLNFKIRQHDKREVIQILSDQDSILISDECFLEECKAQYKVLKDE